MHRTRHAPRALAGTAAAFMPSAIAQRSCVPKLRWRKVGFGGNLARTALYSCALAAPNFSGKPANSAGASQAANHAATRPEKMLCSKAELSSLRHIWCKRLTSRLPTCPGWNAEHASVATYCESTTLWNDKLALSNLQSRVCCVDEDITL